MDCQGVQKMARKEDRMPRDLQNDQGGHPLAILTPPGPPGLLPGLFLDPLAVHQTTLSYSLQIWLIMTELCGFSFRGTEWASEDSKNQ